MDERGQTQTLSDLLRTKLLQLIGNRIGAMRLRLWISDTLVWDELYPMTPSTFDLGAQYSNSKRIGIKLAL